MRLLYLSHGVGTCINQHAQFSWSKKCVREISILKVLLYTTLILVSGPHILSISTQLPLPSPSYPPPYAKYEKMVFFLKMVFGILSNTSVIHIQLSIHLIDYALWRHHIYFKITELVYFIILRLDIKLGVCSYSSSMIFKTPVHLINHAQNDVIISHF